MLHLSYHDGEHYNSVRRADDYSRAAPADIPETLQPVADVAQVRRDVCVSATDFGEEGEGGVHCIHTCMFVCQGDCASQAR